MRQTRKKSGEIILLEKIHHINLALKNKSLSALALSLTLPDIWQVNINSEE